MAMLCCSQLRPAQGVWMRPRSRCWTSALESRQFFFAAGVTPSTFGVVISSMVPLERCAPSVSIPHGARGLIGDDEETAARIQRKRARFEAPRVDALDRRGFPGLLVD